MITAIKDFKLKESYAKLIEKKISYYLDKFIYFPLFEIINEKPKAVNSQSDIDIINQALKAGLIYYEYGAFSAKDKFSNKIVLIFQKWGAKFNRYKKQYELPLNNIPEQIRIEIAQSKMKLEMKYQAIDTFLEDIQNNLDEYVNKMIFDDEVKTILDDAGDEVQKNTRKIAVIVPELDERQKQEIADTYTNSMRYYIKDFEEKRIPEMRAKVQELTLQGYRPDSIAKMLQKEYGIKERKAKFLAQNETSIMLAEYKRVTYQKMGFEYFKWSTIIDGKERELHKELNGQIFRYDNPPVIDERTGQTGLPGQTYNCLLGEMSINSPFLYNRIFKRKFAGEVTEIVLPMGTLKVTPNHPILTDKGWIAAKNINIGDQIAKISDKTFFRTGINPNNIKTTIEEFFSFYSILFDTQRVSHSNFDFHGDISIDEQVDIINIKNKLGNYFKTNFSQFDLEQLLTEADKLGIFTTSNGTFQKAFPVSTLASNGFIGRLDKIFSFFFGGELHTIEHSFRAIAWLDTLLFKTCGYSTSTNTEFLSKLFNTPSDTIKFYQLVLWDIFFNCFSKNIIPLLPHGVREVSCATSETLGNLSQAKPCFIEFDTVIDKFSSKSSFIHIYNLENSNHWYFTENYITKNCRCEAIPFKYDNPFSNRTGRFDSVDPLKYTNAKQREKLKKTM